MSGRLACNDVTNTVNVEQYGSVNAAIRAIFEARYPGYSFEVLDRAFGDLNRLFRGALPGYLACDTPYHDLRHTLDVTLAMARLIEGHDRIAAPAARLGPERAVIGVIVALLHDSGYIREISDTRVRHGAEYTKIHVGRSARFISRYLPQVGLESHVPVASQIVHFTGYEVGFDRIEVSDVRDRTLGHILGTADLIAQMSDRLYLEKCRDFLFEEFVLGGIARQTLADGTDVVVYASPEDLLRKTPAFHDSVVNERLSDALGAVDRYAAVHFGGRNLYAEAIDRHLRHLRRVLDEGRMDALRRGPRTLTLIQAAGERQAA
jgi:hypothetical protein